MPFRFLTIKLPTTWLLTHTLILPDFEPCVSGSVWYGLLNHGHLGYHIMFMGFVHVVLHPFLLLTAFPTVDTPQWIYFRVILGVSNGGQQNSAALNILVHVFWSHVCILLGRSRNEDVYGQLSVDSTKHFPIVVESIFSYTPTRSVREFCLLNFYDYLNLSIRYNWMKSTDKAILPWYKIKKE